MLKKRSFLFFVGTLLFLGSSNPRCGPQLSADCKKFYDLPAVQRDKEFRVYPVERQFDLYLCGMGMEPPQMGLAGYIAEHGEKIIPFLSEKLKTEKDEFKQRHIIFVFEVISDDGYLRNNQDVVDLIADVVSRMTIERIKEDSERMLREIEKNSSR